MELIILYSILIVVGAAAIIYGLLTNHKHRDAQKH